MVLASCEPSRFQGSAVLGGNILSGVAFSAGPGHSFCCVGQGCPSLLLLNAGMVNSVRAPAGELQGWNTGSNGQKGLC